MVDSYTGYVILHCVYLVYVLGVKYHTLQYFLSFLCIPMLGVGSYPFVKCTLG